MTKVGPLTGVGRGANFTALTMGALTLRGASAGGASAGAELWSSEAIALRGGSGSVDTGARGDSAAGAGTRVRSEGGLATFVRMLVSWVNASCWLSVKGASGEPEDGFWRARTMSAMPAKMRSLEFAKGMVVLVGNQVSVSQRRVARVSHIHTV